MYNFRFDAHVPPEADEMVLCLFRPDAPGALAVEACVPSTDCSTTSYFIAAGSSAGVGALISSACYTSIAANDFTLVIAGTPSSASSLFFHGSAQIQVGDGFRCVGGR